MDRRILEHDAESIFWTTWRLQLTIPSVLAEGEEFALRITSFAPDEMPRHGFDREIVFTESPGIEGLPKSVALFPEDGGCTTVRGLTAVGPETARIVAVPQGCPGEVKSNPAWVRKNPPYRVFWGDLHVHTKTSNCHAWACKDPEFCYAYARDAARLDFAAAADHLRGIASEPERWARLQELSRVYNEPGRFVSFLAFESSHRSGYGGDNNAYFLGDDAPYFWLDREDMKGNNPEVSMRQLWDFLDATGEPYMTAPHHTARAFKYREFEKGEYDPEREAFFEVYSSWGSSERRHTRFGIRGGNSEEAAYLQDALRAGCRYGVLCSSDDHRTMPGGQGYNWTAPAGTNNLSAYVHRGLAAIRAPELSRKALWDALWKRRTYGTTFARTLLDFSIGDAQMGDAVKLGAGDSLRKKRTVTVDLLPEDHQAPSVILVRNGEDIARADWSPEKPQVTFTDEEPLERVAIRDARFHPEPFVVYYVRAENVIDQTQWSSPIWLDL